MKDVIKRNLYGLKRKGMTTLSDEFKLAASLSSYHSNLFHTQSNELEQ